MADSVGGAHGTIIGPNFTFVTTGLYLEGLGFSGDTSGTTYVDFPDLLIQNLSSSELTFEIWYTYYDQGGLEVYHLNLVTYPFQTLTLS